MKKHQKMYYWIIILIVLVSLIPLCILSFYDHPSADDYDYAIITHAAWVDTHSLRKVFWAAVQTSGNFWNSWQGLYSSAFVLALQPAIFGEKYYAVTGILMIAIILCTNWLFCWYMLHRSLNATKLEAFACGCVLSFLMIQWMPAVTEGVYWYNGAMNYVFFYGIFVCLLCLLISINRHEVKWKDSGKIILLCFLGIILAGGNHVTAFGGILLLAGLILISIVRKKKVQIIINAVVEVCTVSGFLVNVTSPGTKNRQACFTDRPGVFGAIWKAILTGTTYINSWIGIAVIVCMVLMFPLMLKMSRRLREQTAFAFRYPLLVVLGSVAWICAMFCPSYYAMNNGGAGRLVNIVYFFFVMLMFVNEFYMIGWLDSHIVIKKQDNNHRVWYVSAGILVVGMCLACGRQSTGFQAWYCLKDGSAMQYSEEAFMRNDSLCRAEGEDVTLAPYTVKPGLLFFDDITNDPGDWRNDSMRSYYNLNSVVLAE